jgi:hypothetical protein
VEEHMSTWAQCAWCAHKPVCFSCSRMSNIDREVVFEWTEEINE